MKNLVSRTESRFALDATAFYQGFHLRSNITCITTGLVFAEISHIQRNLSILDSLISNRRIMIFQPSDSTLRTVILAVKQIGETQLSDADISIVALAKECNATLVSDDFAVCNLAKTLSIDLLNLGTKGIRDRRKWVKFCKSCGRGYPPTQTICSLCGNKLRVRYKKLLDSKIAQNQE